MCTENSDPADPESVANADDYLHEVDCVEFPSADNADPAVPENITDTDSELIEIYLFQRHQLAVQKSANNARQQSLEILVRS